MGEPTEAKEVMMDGGKVVLDIHEVLNQLGIRFEAYELFKSSGVQEAAVSVSTSNDGNPDGLDWKRSC